MHANHTGRGLTALGLIAVTALTVACTPAADTATTATAAQVDVACAASFARDNAVKPEAGPIALQLVQLGLVLTLIAGVFHAVLGVFGGAISRFFTGSKRTAGLQKWGLATVLTVLAVRLALMPRTL